jgi:hypothetical protein
MLFLFGRYSQPVKLLPGAAAIAVGIALHHVVYVAAGGVLLLWGVAGLISAARNPRAGRPSS